eukprot:2098129-Alexandrium_andersonii.AAC.1
MADSGSEDRASLAHAVPPASVVQWRPTLQGAALGSRPHVIDRPAVGHRPRVGGRSLQLRCQMAGPRGGRTGARHYAWTAARSDPHA